MSGTDPSELVAGWDVYVVGDRALAGGMAHRDIAATVFEAGARVYQIREKGDVSDVALLAEATAAAALAREAGASLIINDRVALAARCGAHGVHLGQGDKPVAEARRLLGPAAIIGFSTHDAAQLETAIAMACRPETRLDYISLGPLYPTTSKARPDPVVPHDVVAAWRARMPVPLVGIGGITAERIPAALGAGCDIVAVIQAAMAPSPLGMTRQIRELRRIFLAAQGGRITL